jgi:hypothetical protein
MDEIILQTKTVFVHAICLYNLHMTEQSRKKIEMIKKELSALDGDEYQEVLKAILEMVKQGAGRPSRSRSLLELKGLGKELWAQIDVEDYINQERDSW